MTLTGFVYKDPSFPEDTILVSRLLINCCAADASVVGFHARVEDENDYKDGEWISVTGTVKTIFIQIDGQVYEFPVLTGGTICRSAAPEAEDAYIYP
jgi:putative membrane protein